MDKFRAVTPWSEDHAEKMLAKWGDPRDIGSWWPWKRELLTNILTKVSGDSVLDVGCGLGHFYSLLRDIEYLGLDYQPMVNMCKRFFPEGNFRVGSIYNLDDVGIWDVVVVIQVLIHLPDFESLVKSLWSHTEEKLVFTIFPPEEKERFWYKPDIYGISEPILGHVVSRKQFENLVGNLDKLWSCSHEVFTHDGKTVWIVTVER